MRQFLQPIKQLVMDGEFQFGNYNQMIETINPLEANLFNALTPEVFKRSRLKEWHAFQFGNDQFFCFLAIMDLKVSSVVQMTLYDKIKRHVYKRRITLPPMSLSPLPSLLHHHFYFAKEDVLIDLYSNLANDQLILSLAFKNEVDQMAVKLQIEASAVGCQPLISCIPLQSDPASKNLKAMYAHKQVMPMSGHLMIGTKKYQMNARDSFFIVDDQKAFYPFEIKWHWTTCAYFSEAQLIGLNLTANQSTNPELYNENALWVDGEVFLLPAVTYIVTPLEWRIQDEAGTVRLTFTPKLLQTIDESVFYVKSHYKGPFGVINGTVTVNHKTYVFKDAFGMSEDFYLRA